MTVSSGIPEVALARPYAMGKLSLETSSNSNTSAPRVRGAGDGFQLADWGNRLLLQVDCGLSHLIERRNGLRVGFVAALSQYEFGEFGGNVRVGKFERTARNCPSPGGIGHTDIRDTGRERR